MSYPESALRNHPGANPRRSWWNPSRWLPHIGAKERGRHAKAETVAVQAVAEAIAPPAPASTIMPGDSPVVAQGLGILDEAFASAFHVGQVVDWTSSGTTKRGVVTHVVPVGKMPADVEAKVKTDGAPRDHVSYVVRANSTNYWPRVSLLSLAVPG